METMNRVNELMTERNLTLYRLSQMSGVSYSTLKNTAKRNGQLSVDTIERICEGLRIPLSEFFSERS